MNENSFESFDALLKRITNNEELASFFYTASTYMELLHNTGLYITNFDPKHIKTNGKSVVFERTDRRTNRIIGDEVQSNIEAFTSLMVGAYIHYTKSLLPFEQLQRIYKEVKYSFPEEDEGYFDAVINEKQVFYYHQYVDNRKNFIEGNTNLNVRVKSKSTAVGRAMSNREGYNRQAAFANVLVVSAIVCLIALVAVLTYVILK